MNRAALLRGGIGVGLAVFVPAARAATIPDGDLAYLRLLLATELLKADAESRALAAKKLNARAASLTRRMHADDAAHYRGLATLLTGAGQQPATAGDIDFSYPKGSFGSQHAILALAHRLATLSLGGYLGALETVQTPQLRLPLGQIAANEAQQASALAQLLGRPVIGGAFAPSLSIDDVSAALDKYES